MDKLPKNISFSQSEVNAYLLLSTKMVIFDIDYKTEKQILEICNNFYAKYKLNLRIYQTSNGHRVFLTNRKFNFINDFNILSQYTNELQADKQYLIFTFKRNRIFTARVAPKSINAANLSTIKDLVSQFETYKNNPNQSVTKYITSIKDEIILEDFKDFINEHDEITKAFNKNSILI